MFDRLLHHKLLTDGIEGEGVITGTQVEGMDTRTGVMGFYLGVEGHIKFADGTEATFSSKGLDTIKVGDLDAGTVVPVRYDADHKYVVLDIPKLEAKKEAKNKADAEWLEHHNAEKIAAADAAVAKANESGHQD
jgi:hypothetical protein